jgi:hypothetical protein
MLLAGGVAGYLANDSVFTSITHYNTNLTVDSPVHVGGALHIHADVLRIAPARCTLTTHRWIIDHSGTVVYSQIVPGVATNSPSVQHIDRDMQLPADIGPGGYIFHSQSVNDCGRASYTSIAPEARFEVIP